MKHYDDAQVEEKIHIFFSKKLRKYPELAMGSHDTFAVVPRTTSIITDFLWGITNGSHSSSR